MNGNDSYRREDWHLDKRVPVIFIAVLFAQTLGFGWWGATLTGTVSKHSEEITEIRKQFAGADISTRDQSERLARIEERQRSTVEVLREIKDDVRKLLDERRGYQ